MPQRITLSFILSDGPTDNRNVLFGSGGKVDYCLKGENSNPTHSLPSPPLDLIIKPNSNAFLKGSETDE